MNTQSSNYNTDDTRPDGATIELDTQQYSRKGADSNTGQQVSDKAGQLAGQAKDAIGETAGKVREQAISQVDAQKARATDALSSVASAVRKTGEHLRQEDQGAIAGYADAAADQIDRFSTYLNNRDFNDLAIEVQRFARRQPAIFLGGALVAGMLAARFLKSSSQQAQGGSNDSYGYAGYGGYNSGYSSYGTYRARSSYPDYGSSADYADTGYGESDYSADSGAAARVPASGYADSGAQAHDSAASTSASTKGRGGQSSGQSNKPGKNVSGGTTGSSGTADSGDGQGQEVS